MMNCENCGHALASGAIICRECKHNNALRRVGETRARRVTTEIPEAPARRVASFNTPPRPENHTPPAKVQPIRSLAQAAPTLVAEDELELRQYPPWRAQLKEKVRQARERRQPDEAERAPVADETHLDPNPLVESALKRLQRPDYTPTAQPLPRIVRRGAQAAALADENEDELEALPAPEPKPAPKPELKAAPRAPSPTNPLSSRRTDPFSTQQSAPPAAERPPITRAESKDTKTSPLRATTPSVTPMTTRTESKPELKSAPPVAPKTAPLLEMKRADKPASSAARVTLPTADKPTSGASSNPPMPSAPVVKPVADADAALATPPRQPVTTQVIGLMPAAQSLPEIEPPPFVLAPDRDAQVATLWVRTLAGACDFEVVCASYLPLFASYATLDTSLGSESLAIMLLLLATITFCYQLLTLNIAGRTFGMAMLNLRLLNRADEMQPPTRQQRFIRALGATVAFLCPPLNLLFMHLNRERRSLPDLCSRTTIIES
jgi:uncharacterized RDD family membrane protein YckC